MPPPLSPSPPNFKFLPLSHLFRSFQIKKENKIKTQETKNVFFFFFASWSFIIISLMFFFEKKIPKFTIFFLVQLQKKFVLNAIFIWLEL